MNVYPGLQPGLSHCGPSALISLCPIHQVSRIEGLTTVPIKLTNYWSQTFNATHFPGMMHFLFEPRLDPSVTPEQRAELHAADVAAIYVHGNGYKDHRWEDRPDDPPGCYVLKLVGLDNRIRDFGD